MNLEQQSPRTESRALRHEVYIPMLLTLISILMWLCFQAIQLWIEHRTLSEMYTNQEPIIQTAQKMRMQLDALASGVQKLSDEGNPNAKLIVEDLRSKGITINPPSENAPSSK